ncbi:MAG: hypothetical protein ACLQLC_12865 [Candidatus Sulfotelmatobacter sp.]
MNRNWKMVLGAAVLLTAAASLLVWRENSGLQVVRAQTARGGAIHGYVGALLASPAEATVVAPGAVINLPDITVYAKSVKTGVSSAPVKTNPQGYFRTGTLAPGVYHICVEGTGYTSSCDRQEIEIFNSTYVMNHTVEIRPAAGAIDGTVWLANQVTPCFWFRPAFAQAVIAAKVSLLDTGGNVVAGPVNGNSVGQYVLPVSGSQGGFTLRAVCEGLASDVGVKFPGGGMLQQNITIRNNAPQIASVNLAKAGVGVRVANPGDTLQVTVVATDLDGDTLHYQWTDDSGRALGLPDAATVNWTLLNSPAINTIRVQVSDGKGGYAASQQSLRAGVNGILFQGTLLGRVDGKAVGNAAITLNGVSTTSDARGQFQVEVPNASRFVLNISQQGFALVSRVFYAQATGLQIPMDATQTVTVNGRTGGPVQGQPGDCECACEAHHDHDHDHDRDHDRDDHHDWDHDRWRHDHDHDHAKKCKSTTGQLAMTLAPNSLVDGQGNAYTGTAKVEMFQYDTTLPNPIPGDQGAISQGKAVRLATFGAFYIQPRDSAGNPLQMAAGKKANVTMPIEPTLLAKAPATVPFLRYDESTGLWTEVGTLTRSGNNYVGTINHFSVFNADTEFGGSACVKVILDPDTFQSFPYALDGTYVDPSSGQFHHNGTQVTANPIGVERMPPNVNFTLDVYDATNTNLLKSVTLNSGPALAAAFSNQGYDTSPTYNDCNGPVTIYNNTVPTGDLTYLMPITGGTIQDNSVAYQNATNAGTGGNRATFTAWLSANGFVSGATESQAIYFNNGDLKFGRNMNCRVTNTSTGYTACYVSNYGNVGENDSAQALVDARTPGEAPVATVAMEYNPSPPTPGEGVNFWAYDKNGNYLSHPTLDNQGAKPMPNMCQGCHGGYFDSGTGLANGSIFLPFDLDSFIYDTEGDPHSAIDPTNYAAVQEQFRQLNNIVLNTDPDGLTGDNNKPVTQLMNLWYPGGVQNSGQQFSFNHAIAANQGGFPSNGPLYDTVVKPACRTCHLAQGQSIDWTSYSQMSTQKSIIQLFACGGGSPAAHTTQNFAMPHSQVPFLLFWQNSLSSTLDSELGLTGVGCPNN